MKTGGFAARQLTGLLEFTRRFPRFSPLLLCDPHQLPAAERLGVPAMSWRDFIVHGPAGGTA